VSERTYGAEPEVVMEFRPEWLEYMHYLYLPVVMPEADDVRLPQRLEFLRPAVSEVCRRELEFGRKLYVYVTARRGWASPGNPLNRPGWHADGFGSDDVNYIWSDRWPTRFATGEFVDISDDHVLSAEQFDRQVEWGWVNVNDGLEHTVYRLDPSVIHATPIITPPGGHRSFFKISVSPNRYNLEGNSHNYLFDYDWKMWSREEVRNDPAYAGGDAGPQEVPAA
jgi:hypothetical protein